MRKARVYQTLALALLAAVLLWMVVGRGAQALPPAGTDRLPVVATANVTSRLGTESVVFTGWAEIERQAPHNEGGVDVVDFEVVAMDLRGAASIGAVTVAESATQVSSGEIRSLQAGQDFPASSFMDVFIEVTVPANPTPTLELHNLEAMHLLPMAGNQATSLSAWPPLGVTYRLDPIYGVDNDGNNGADEDTADDDGDGAYDEDGPGLGNQDTDALTDEDPALADCTLPVCDDDGDGQMDEDPSCVPLFNASGSSLKAGFCVRDLTLAIAPETPSFSVAPGGPSNLHPADILGLVKPPTQPGPVPPTPVVVSNNDNFANAYAIPAAPFVGVQNTSGNTLQIGAESGQQCANNTDDDADGAVNDGCPLAGQAETGAQCANQTDDDADGLVNDGCPAADEPATLLVCPVFSVPIWKTAWYQFTPLADGMITFDTVGSYQSVPGDGLFDTVLAVYTGSSLSGITQTRVACNDDISGSGAASRVTFEAAGGTTYRIQVGSFTNMGGNLQLNMYSGAPPAADDTMPFVRIPCSELGLTPDGCATGGPTPDDLDGLSYGDDFPDGAASAVHFSVAPGSEGVQGSAVRAQRMCPAPEPQGDEFRATFNNSNTLFLDGNGPIGSCTSAFPLGLIEGASARDDLDALDENDPSFVDPDQDGTPDSPVYFSLAPASPSLLTLGFTAADVLKTAGGNTPTVFAAQAALGLEADDDIDGLCLKEDGDGAFDLDDVLRFSLAAGSPTLAQIGAGPADILAPGAPNPSVVQNETTMGLLTGDDLDAMKCQALYFKDPLGDTDGDTIPNGTDPDDDNDGCTDVQESGPDPTLGGQRDPHNFWDLMDVFTGSPLGRDGAVAAGDIAGVVARFGANDAGPGDFDRNSNPLSTPNPPTQPSGTRANYHPAYDRGGSIQGGSPWNLLRADGAITSGDIAATVAQFGHSCV